MKTSSVTCLRRLDVFSAEWDDWKVWARNWFAPDAPLVGKRNSSPSPTRWDTFQHAFALAVDVQERICQAMLALRAATDVIIRKKPGQGHRSLWLAHAAEAYQGVNRHGGCLAPHLGLSSISRFGPAGAARTLCDCAGESRLPQLGVNRRRVMHSRFRRGGFFDS
jgi:hypothetical protein